MKKDWSGWNSSLRADLNMYFGCMVDKPHSIEDALNEAILRTDWGEGIDIQVSWWMSDITECWFWASPMMQRDLPRGTVVDNVEINKDGSWAVTYSAKVLLGSSR